MGEEEENPVKKQQWSRGGWGGRESEQGGQGEGRKPPKKNLTNKQQDPNLALFSLPIFSV